MKNKLGRKSVSDFKKMAETLIEETFCTAFDVGYQGAKSETPSPEDMAAHLVDRYTNEELSEMLLILDSMLAPSRVKSPNQRRAELIQRARKFVEGQRVVRKGKKFYISPGYVGFWCSADFVVNADKRTVVCLLKSVSDNVKSRGIAKCMPGEVFNAEIGKAIALARALEIEVPTEFLEAVQPDDFAIGQVTAGARTGVLKGKVLRISRGKAYTDNGSLWGNPFNSGYAKIVDDTHAQYEVPS